MESPPPCNKNLSHVISYVESQRERQFSRCGCLEIFHQYLNRTFYKFGYLVASSPSYFIIIPLFLTLLGITGIQQLNYLSDPEHLFAPRNGPGRYERDIVEKYFPVDYSNNFTPDRLTKISHFARIIIKDKDGGTIFREDIWRELNSLHDAIMNFTIVWKEKEYSYDDLCAMRDGDCLENQAITLNEIMPEVINGTAYINYPIMLFPFVLPYIYGGPTINETEGVLLAAEAIALGYFLKEDTLEEKEQGHIWEDKLKVILEELEFDHIDISFYVSRALEDELERNANSVIPYFAVNFSFMILFSTLSVGRLDWVRSKIILGPVAVLSSLFATISAAGYLMYFQVPFIGLCNAIPFLMLGIGLDDMFVLLSAWHRTRIQDDVRERLAATYSEAGVSITITSLTNMLSFFVGSVTPFPSVHIFCLYTGTSVFFLYVWFLTLFGGCLALAGRLEQNQKHNLLFTKTVKAKSQADGCWYRFWCAGGVNPDDVWNKMDNKEHPVMLFCRDYLGRMLSKAPVKAFVIAVFAVYLGGAIFGITRLEEGLEKRKLALDDSFLVEYFNNEDSLFKKFPYRIQVVIHDNLTYSDPETEKKVLELHNNFENSKFIGKSMFSRSVLRSFYRHLDRRPKIKAEIFNGTNDDSAFIDYLFNKFLRDGSDYWNDIAVSEDEKKIIATRFIIQSQELIGANADKEMMIELRKIAEEAPFDVEVFNQFFIFFDQYLLVRTTSIKSICAAAMAMIVISILFIPSFRCAFLVGFSIVSIEIGVIGYMALWKVNLDSVSMINLIMCIGFSVDFSAHISYAYLASKEQTPNGKLRDCLYSLGLPVIQGGISTILGVIILFFAPSYIFQTFFKIVFLVITFGVMHGLFLLPVLLSIFEAFSCNRGERNVIPVSGPIIEAVIKSENKTDAIDLAPHIVSVKEVDVEDSEKDLGIGSSGTSSQSSCSSKEEQQIPEHDLGEVRNVISRRLSSLSSRMGVHNEGFLNEEDEVERL